MTIEKMTAGEDLEAGDAVVMGDDGKVYKLKPIKPGEPCPKCNKKMYVYSCTFKQWLCKCELKEWV